MIRDFRDLDVWKRAMDLVDDVYDLCDHFPPGERFGLCAQLRRACVSVPSNIAEGRARGSTREFLRGVAIASGSLAEVETQVLVAQRRDYVSEDDTASLFTRTHELMKMLNGLRAALKRRLRQDHS